MSTEHVNEFDIEYGPTPEDASREYTDIEPSIAWKFAIWLTVAMLMSVAIVYGAFWFFESREVRAQRAAQTFPLAAGQDRNPPAPNLQTQPFKDIYMLRQQEDQKLLGYGWVDKGTGVAHIPVDDAMRLLLERGELQPRGTPETPGQYVVSDSSAGRVAVSR
jgi:hypothetical protein